MSLPIICVGGSGMWWCVPYISMQHKNVTQKGAAKKRNVWKKLISRWNKMQYARSRCIACRRFYPFYINYYYCRKRRKKDLILFVFIYNTHVMDPLWFFFYVVRVTASCRYRLFFGRRTDVESCDVWTQFRWSIFTFYCHGTLISF